MLGSIPAQRQRQLDRISARAPRAAKGFLNAYYRGVDEDELAARDPSALARAALLHRMIGSRRRAGEARVSIVNPDGATHGFTSRHTLVTIVCDDMPFLVDSIGMVFAQLGLSVHFIAHPVLRVERDGRGALRGLARADGGRGESWQQYEVDRVLDPARLADLEQRLRATLADVTAATTDWPAMRARAGDLVDALARDGWPVPAAEVAEARDLLQWMQDGQFTFLGYREYRLARGRYEDRLVPLTRTGLGLLRSGRPNGRPAKPTVLRGAIRDHARAATLLVLTKANSVATVHRATYLDYVGVKVFDTRGNVVGERRFLGLWTSSAYSMAPAEIPVLREKVAQIVAHFGLPAASHDGKALLHAIAMHPRDELFQADVPHLIRTLRGIVNLYERSQVRLFVRRDAFRRFYSCLAYVPRDRYSTDVRERLVAAARAALHGTAVEFQVQLSESILARIHLLVRTSPDDTHKPDFDALEQSMAVAVQSFGDRLRAALVADRDESVALALLGRYADAFPAAYEEATSPAEAVTDIDAIESLPADADALGLGLSRSPGQGFHQLHLKLYRRGAPIPISDVLPTMENMGLKLISERPYAVHIGSGDCWIQDFELEHPGGVAIDLATDGPRLRETFVQVWRGAADNDGFNRLVLAADLTWREVVAVRAYCRWLSQAGLPFSQSYVEQVLAANATAAGALARRFLAQFDPALAPRERARRIDRSQRLFKEALTAVARLDDDRILRALSSAIDGTLRTNYFQRRADGTPKEQLSLKLEPRRIPETPQPRPMFEIWVHSPRVEGVHLRMGLVARGGLRWSDRRDDFRTEVLGLMKAQNVKNTLIVPVGAKGGFVPRKLPTGREAMQVEGTECYRAFVRALLDVTDNIVAGKVVPPPDVVRRDGDDPYLVVAADKGTATFSDVANRISAEYGHWLGDAFASGGSAGYDHKAMGITARGGWESVKRLFREFGVDTQAQDFTVAGIGDMAGDVFGNGMLQSPHIRLVAAFNHAHIFIDPEPDAARTFRERQRLFALPRSTWEDYDRKLISRGGGVWSRQSKSLSLPAESRRLLGVDAEATPHEVIKAILRLKVDLLWNGGIGTYVKASDESHAEVGDRANDAVRVDGRELRCRVIGEGGNLGLSQRGRVEYALTGGRINTDFIDNSGGVNCSDVEVNIKILLNGIERDGRLTRPRRDALLKRMTPEVAALVLRNNYLQGQAISILELHATDRLTELTHLIRALERGGMLDRKLESLPDDEQLAERGRDGRGLARPELAMLLSYAKIWLYDQLIGTDVPEDPYLARELSRYFPLPIQQRFGDDLERHPLRREIIVTATTNSMVNRMGPAFALRTQEDTGADLGQVARAYTISREVTGVRALWADIEALDNRVPAAQQYRMMHETARVLGHLTYWMLARPASIGDIEGTVSRLGPGLAALLDALPGLLTGVEQLRHDETLRKLKADGVPEKLARRVAALGAAQAAIDIVDVAQQRKLPAAGVASAYFQLGEAIGLDTLRLAIERLEVEGHWQSVARGTLREDAYALQRTLTQDVLAGRGRGAPAARVGAWLAARPQGVAQVRRVLDEVQRDVAADFATLSVALQAARRLAEH